MDIMNILRTGMNMSIPHILVWLCYITYYIKIRIAANNYIEVRSTVNGNRCRERKRLSVQSSNTGRSFLFYLGARYINPCWLFNTKSSLYTYMKYIWFGLVGFHGISTIVGYLMPIQFHACIKYMSSNHILLINQLFVFIQLHAKIVIFQTNQFSAITQFSTI